MPELVQAEQQIFVDENLSSAFAGYLCG